MEMSVSTELSEVVSERGGVSGFTVGLVFRGGVCVEELEGGGVGELSLLVPAGEGLRGGDVEILGRFRFIREFGGPLGFPQSSPRIPPPLLPPLQGGSLAFA